MTEILKRFWTWAISLAGVAGLYLGAKQLDWLPVFWIVLAAAAALSIFPTVGKKSLEAYSRLRAYPELSTQIAATANTIDKLKVEIRTAKRFAAESFNSGIIEGRAQVLGAILSEAIEPPKLQGIVETDGTLFLIALFKDVAPQKEARFTVVGNVLGDRKGAVEVVSVDELKKTVHLQCVEETIPKFWAHLRERVPYDESPPPRVELGAYTVGDLVDAVEQPQQVTSEAGEVASE